MFFRESVAFDCISLFCSWIIRVCEQPQGVVCAIETTNALFPLILPQLTHKSSPNSGRACKTFCFELPDTIVKKERLKVEPFMGIHAFLQSVTPNEKYLNILFI